MQKSIEIDGVKLSLSNPVENRSQWIGQTEVLRQLTACWIVVDDQDLPLAPRLIAPLESEKPPWRWPRPL